MFLYRQPSTEDLEKHRVACARGDGIIDIFDAILLAGSYNSTPSTPNWNPNADINGDNIVDIFDAVLLAGNLGKAIT